MFKLALFDDFQLIYQEQAIDLARRPRMQSLLAFLAVNRHMPQTRRDVIHALWPDAAESSGRNRLRNLLHQLRKTLPGWEELIQIEPTTLQWRLSASDALDVAHFETQLAIAFELRDPHQKELALTSAVEQYVGDLFPACPDEWIEAPRFQLRERLIDALVQMILLAETRQAWGVAQQVAERLLVHDPLHEATYCRVMQLYGRLGDTASVMRIYERCREMLAQELDVEPSEAIQSLYRQLTMTDAALSQAARPALNVARPATLIGRDDEWAELQQLWRRVQNGGSRMVVIQGEAGIGKTRLAQDFFNGVKQEQAFAASASCFAVEEDLAFGPVAEWLRAEPFWQSLASLEDEWLLPISRLLPELRGRFSGLAEASAPAENLQRQHFFTALAVALLEHGQPVLLCLDDLQWSDAETLDWLHYLLRYETQTPLLVVATLRTDDAAERARCQPLLRELARRDRLSEITLKPLSISDTTTLAQQMLGSELYPVYVAQLYHETDGNPFYIVETVRARPHSFVDPGSTVGAEKNVETQAVRRLPAKIQALIQERMARLSPLALEIMQLAAVIGRRFDTPLLAATTKRSEEEVMQGMEELWTQRIVREAARNRFGFVHDLVRQVAYAGLSPMRKRFLHRKIATELVSMYHGELGEISGQVAVHFEAAGVFAEAVKYYVQTAGRDAQTNAFHHAEIAYANAIRLGKQINLPDTAFLGELYLRRGRILELSGDYTNAVAVYRELDTFAQANGDRVIELEAVARQVTCHIEPSTVHDRKAALTLLSRGLELARQIGNRKVEVQLLRTKMVDAAHYGHIDEAYDAGEAAITAARTDALLPLLATVLNDLAANMRLSGRQRQAKEYAEEARSLFRAQNNLPMLADNLAQQAWNDLHQMDFDGALSFADQCIELCQQINNNWNRCLAYQTKAQVMAIIGNWGNAIALFEQAIAHGKESGFALAMVMPANLLGDLLRTMGFVERAEHLHRTAHAVAEQKAPFVIHSVEAQLAMNAYVQHRMVEGDRWLRAAMEHQPFGVIGRGWCTLPHIARAAVMGAETSGLWESVLDLTKSALDEAYERALPVHLPSLLIAKSRCLLALKKDKEAEATLLSVGEMSASLDLHPSRWHMHALLARLRQRQNRSVQANKEIQSAQAERNYLATSLGNAELAASFLALTSS